MAQCAQDLLALAPAPQRLAVAGLSMGGYTALAAAAAAPGRLAGLALLNSQCRADSPEVKARRAAQVAAVAAAGGSLRAVLVAQAGLLLHHSRLPASVSRAVAALEAEAEAAAAAAAGAAACSSSSTDADAASAAGAHAAAAAARAAAAGAALPEPHPAFAAFVRGALECGASAFAQQQRCIAGRADACGVLQALAQAGVPMAALTGSHDALIPPKAARDMHALMGAAGGARAVVVEGCGHLSALEAPGEVADALLEWLARVDAAERGRGEV
jgi:pimeloyl-ACP methyl ester carboxylesterase